MEALEETPSDPGAEQPVDNVNPEAPAETSSEQVTAPVETSLDTAQTTLAAEESEENQIATPQKVEPSITRLPSIKSLPTYVKSKVEKLEKKIKTDVNAFKELKKYPRKIVKIYSS
ncbi:uncharacterized protein LOC144454217 isoform X2 [Phascolarctos cinereus]